MAGAGRGCDGVGRLWEGVYLVLKVHTGSYPFQQQPAQPLFLLRLVLAKLLAKVRGYQLQVRSLTQG